MGIQQEAIEKAIKNRLLAGHGEWKDIECSKNIHFSCKNFPFDQKSIQYLNTAQRQITFEDLFGTKIYFGTPDA